jgi:mRNA-degrading endonuclease HigB of HigAB toxin-antitoxin module
MLISPDLIKKNLLPDNLDLSHIEDNEYVFAISGSEFQNLKEKRIEI